MTTETALQVVPESVPAIVNPSAHLYARASKADNTIDAYAAACNNRGITHHSLKAYDQALADYGQAIALVPQYAGAFANRGRTRCALADYAGAAADFGAAIELKPAQGRVLRAQGASAFPAGAAGRGTERLRQGADIESRQQRLSRPGRACRAAGQCDRSAGFRAPGVRVEPVGRGE
jgi:tetratricopeptide (TPR) repeat protein